MKLTFRGIQYNTNQSNVAVEESQTKGTYRGVTITFHAVEGLKSFATPQHLTYRGVAA